MSAILPNYGSPLAGARAMMFAEFKALVEEYGPIQKDGRGWRGRCPTHADDGKRGDLSFEERDGRILLHCWKGCAPKAVVESLGLQWSDLFLDGQGKTPGKKAKAGPRPQNKKVYPTVEAAGKALAKRFKGTFLPSYPGRYDEANGTESFHVLRFDSLPNAEKTYRPIHPVPGGYEEGDPEGKLVLKNLPGLVRDARSLVWVSEGEKCAHALASVELLGTTSAHGAKSAYKTDWTPLAGRDVVIVPDNNADGRLYADAVRKLLGDLDPPAKVRIVMLPGLPDGKDIYDWLEERDATEPEALRAQLEDLAEKAKPKTGKQDTSMEPVYVCLADVEAKAVHWLWQDRFPFAMLSLLVGVEGRGKTFVALDMAARVTTGSPWPDATTEHDSPTVGNVIFLTSEDHLEYTIRPRLDAMKADVKRVRALQAVKTPAGEQFFDVLQHLPALEAMIQEVGDVRLVIVDPLTAFLGPTDQDRNGEVRTALARFSSLAERHGCAILGISHLCKDVNRAAIHRTIGSVAFSAAARAVMLVGEDKQDEKRRVFVPVKCNLTEMRTSLAFRIEEGAVVWEHGLFDYDPDEILTRDHDKGKLDEAQNFLRETLADGRMQAKEVKRLARENGISERTLWRAKSKAKVVDEREGIGPLHVSYWRLPDES